MWPWSAAVPALIVLLATAASAAPPTVQHLFPAGAQRGQSVAVKLAGSLGDRELFAWCSRPGVQCELSPEDRSTLTVTVAPDTPPGPCWLRVFNAEGAAVPRPFVIGTLPELQETEPNDRLPQATRLEHSRMVANGVLARAGDVDVYAVELNAGETLVASVDAHGLLGSPMDAVLQIVSPEGFVLEQNDDERGLDPQIAFTAQEEGTYYARVFAFPAEPNSSIRFAGEAAYIYRLTLTTGPFVDHVLPLAVAADRETVIQPYGWNLPQPASPLTVPVAGGESPIHIFADDWANTLPLPVVSHPLAAEVPPEAADRPQRLEIPGCMSGRLEQPGEIDRYNFEARQGDKLEFRIAGRSLGYRLDPVLSLRDASGQVLQEVDDVSGSADAVLTRTIAAEGVYSIEVRDRFGGGGMRYAYCLTAVRQGSEFELKLKADRFTLKAGGRLEIPVEVDRGTGFSGEIEISVVGLPAGVSAAEVRSPSSGNGSKGVTLVLTGAKAAAWSGPLRIVGRSLTDRPQTKFARATLPGVQRSISDLHLTVLAAN